MYEPIIDAIDFRVRIMTLQPGECFLVRAADLEWLYGDQMEKGAGTFIAALKHGLERNGFTISENIFGGYVIRRNSPHDEE